MKKPKKSDYNNCRDPQFAYEHALYVYLLWKQANTNHKILKRLLNEKTK